jgi:tryptophan synthase alpha chain
MNALTNLFEKKRNNLLSVYFTAGFPERESTVSIIHSLQKAGVDFVEAGFPFSDPLADGPVIQHTSQVAIDNGMSLDLLLDQLEKARHTISIPVILMGYLNPVLQTGMEEFCRRCAGAGVSGVILPDLPPGHYDDGWRELFRNYNLHMIFLVTPETSESRIREIDRLGSGFIYAVSSSSTTGRRDSFSSGQTAYLKRLRLMGLKNPVMTGFGIHNSSTLQAVWENSSGAIVGTAYLNALMKNTDADRAIGLLMEELGLGSALPM